MTSFFVFIQIFDVSSFVYTDPYYVIQVSTKLILFIWIVKLLGKKEVKAYFSINETR